MDVAIVEHADYLLESYEKGAVDRFVNIKLDTERTKNCPTSLF